jgi:prephenate dehydratase
LQTTTPISSANLTLGVLQGPNTFGGDAARRAIELYPELFNGKTVFYDTAEEALSFADGRADAMCPPQQMTNTGFHPGMQAYVARPDSNLYVIGEIKHAYHCSLLGKPGTQLSQIKKVLGHTGSITQSRHWIEKHIPGAQIIIVDTSSMDAANTVATGDGSVASIGTSGMAQQFGLAELQRDVDGGSVGSYWVVTPKPILNDAPTRVVVAGRFDDGGRLSDVICGLAGVGFHLETVFNVASGKRLFEYDFVLRFGGSGSLAAVKSAVEAVPGARLAGAFVVKD